jgi:predicted nucleotidyltransferase
MNHPDQNAIPNLEIRPRWLVMVQDILRRHIPNREVRAFGSRVVGQPRPFSDLDLAVCGEEPLDDATLVDLRDAFEESDLPIMVDVVPVHVAGPHIIHAIANHSIVIQTPEHPPTDEENQP